ncbi:unnamed protein product [Medioppia subpectinata]|uniref:40S ribosomal protein S6 n=1 Tax=Medioppia subpectinata TaxID=1979941 RepID=A0A7R9KY71_9ACAR|nr:unnamed protein product [Medioppia subpectinata]CAG2112020.1 unnamed protein product [Medioppia subpectinata]
MKPIISALCGDLNISYPATGCQKLLDIDDEKKVRIFYDKRMGQEVEADSLGDEWAGYVVRIAGGNDKQGFPMKQGVLTNARVRLLLSAGHSCYRPRRTGERKRKSVRGCIVDSNLSVLALVVVQKGAELTVVFLHDVRQYVVRRPLAVKEGKKPRTKAPKIQRLITPKVVQRKRRRLAKKRQRAVKRRDQASEYARLLAQRQKEAKEKKAEEARRRRSSASSGGGKTASSSSA